MHQILYPVPLYRRVSYAAHHATLRAGLGVSYLDDKMRAKSHLLAVKLFRPATSPPSGEGGDSTPSAGSRVGEGVLKWVLQVGAACTGQGCMLG